MGWEVNNNLNKEKKLFIITKIKVRINWFVSKTHDFYCRLGLTMIWKVQNNHYTQYMLRTNYSVNRSYFVVGQSIGGLACSVITLSLYSKVCDHKKMFFNIHSLVHSLLKCCFFWDQHIIRTKTHSIVSKPHWIKWLSMEDHGISYII